MEKTVLIFNGNPRSGKSTVQSIIRVKTKAVSYSSIDCVKSIYKKYFDWNGGKTEESRKFLSDMKHFLIAETDIIDKALTDKYNEFMKSDDSILMIDIREPEEIAKYAKKFNAITVLVTNPRAPYITSNVSDKNVSHYKYDVKIVNDGSLLDLEALVEEFLRDLRLEDKLKKELYFQNHFGQKKFIESVDSLEGAFKEIENFLKKRNYKSHYSRYWIEENGNIKIDVGSHSEFFIIKDGKELLI